MNTYMIPIPVMMMVIGDALVLLEINRMTNTGIMENANARRTVRLGICTRIEPDAIASAAPNDAPDDIPVVYGSAIGFLRTLCMTEPQMANPAPPNSAPSTGGVAYRVQWTTESSRSA